MNGHETRLNLKDWLILGLFSIVGVVLGGIVGWIFQDASLYL